MQIHKRNNFPESSFTEKRLVWREAPSGDSVDREAEKREAEKREADEISAMVTELVESLQSECTEERKECGEEVAEGACSAPETASERFKTDTWKTPEHFWSLNSPNIGEQLVDTLKSRKYPKNTLLKVEIKFRSNKKIDFSNSRDFYYYTSEKYQKRFSIKIDGQNPIVFTFKNPTEIERQLQRRIPEYKETSVADTAPESPVPQLTETEREIRKQLQENTESFEKAFEAAIKLNSAHDAIVAIFGNKYRQTGRGSENWKKRREIWKDEIDEKDENFTGGPSQNRKILSFLQSKIENAKRSLATPAATAPDTTTATVDAAETVAQPEPTPPQETPPPSPETPVPASQEILEAPKTYQEHLSSIRERIWTNKTEWLGDPSNNVGAGKSFSIRDSSITDQLGTRGITWYNLESESSYALDGISRVKESFSAFGVGEEKVMGELESLLGGRAQKEITTRTIFNKYIRGTEKFSGNYNQFNKRIHELGEISKKWETPERKAVIDQYNLHEEKRVLYSNKIEERTLLIFLEEPIPKELEDEINTLAREIKELDRELKKEENQKILEEFSRDEEALSELENLKKDILEPIIILLESIDKLRLIPQERQSVQDRYSRIIDSLPKYETEQGLHSYWDMEQILSGSATVEFLKDQSEDPRMGISLDQKIKEDFPTFKNLQDDGQILKLIFSLYSISTLSQGGCLQKNPNNNDRLRLVKLPDDFPTASNASEEFVALAWAINDTPEGQPVNLDDHTELIQKVASQLDQNTQTVQRLQEIFGEDDRGEQTYYSWKERFVSFFTDATADKTTQTLEHIGAKGATEATEDFMRRYMSGNAAIQKILFEIVETDENGIQTYDQEKLRTALGERIKLGVEMAYIHELPSSFEKIETEDITEETADAEKIEEYLGDGVRSNIDRIPKNFSIRDDGIKSFLRKDGITWRNLEANSHYVLDGLDSVEKNLQALTGGEVWAENYLWGLLGDNGTNTITAETIFNLCIRKHSNKKYEGSFNQFTREILALENKQNKTDADQTRLTKLKQEILVPLINLINSIQNLHLRPKTDEERVAEIEQRIESLKKSLEEGTPLDPRTVELIRIGEIYEHQFEGLKTKETYEYSDQPQIKQIQEALIKQLQEMGETPLTQADLNTIEQTLLTGILIGTDGKPSLAIPGKVDLGNGWTLSPYAGAGPTGGAGGFALSKTIEAGKTTEITFGLHAGAIHVGIQGAATFKLPHKVNLTAGATAGVTAIGFYAVGGLNIRRNLEGEQQDEFLKQQEESGLSEIAKLVDTNNTTEAIQALQKHPRYGATFNRLSTEFNLEDKAVLDIFRMMQDDIRSGVARDASSSPISILGGGAFGGTINGIPIAGAYVEIKIGDKLITTRNVTRGITELRREAGWENALKSLEIKGRKATPEYTLLSNTGHIIYDYETGGQAILQEKQEAELDLNKLGTENAVQNAFKEIGINLDIISPQVYALTINAPYDAPPNLKINVDPELTRMQFSVEGNRIIFTGLTPELARKIAVERSDFRYTHEHRGNTRLSVITFKSSAGKTAPKIESESTEYIYQRAGHRPTISQGRRPALSGIDYMARSNISYNPQSVRFIADTFTPLQIEGYSQEGFNRVRERQRDILRVKDAQETNQARQNTITAFAESLSENDKWMTEFKKVSTLAPGDYEQNLSDMVNLIKDAVNKNESIDSLSNQELNSVIIHLNARSFENPSNPQQAFDRWLRISRDKIFTPLFTRIREQNRETITSSPEKMAQRIVDDLKDTNLSTEQFEEFVAGTMFLSTVGTENILGLRGTPYYKNDVISGIINQKTYNPSAQGVEGDLGKALLEILSPLERDTSKVKEFTQSPLAMKLAADPAIYFMLGETNADKVLDIFEGEKVTPQNKEAFTKFREIVVKIRDAQLAGQTEETITTDFGTFKVDIDTQVGIGVYKQCTNPTILGHENLTISMEEPIITTARTDVNQNIRAQNARKINSLILGFHHSFEQDQPPPDEEIPPEEIPPEEPVPEVARGEEVRHPGRPETTETTRPPASTTPDESAPGR